MARALRARVAVYAFSMSLLICSVSAITMVAEGMPNWASLGFFIAMIEFGGGGNLILDTTVFLAFLPGDKHWAVTLLAAWWGLGQAVTGFIAWGFLEMELLVRGDLYSGEQHGLEVISDYVSG
ncbi:hypothetical protein VTK56DRAFT_2706 [Thermocarpiscus australiensis]